VNSVLFGHGPLTITTEIHATASPTGAPTPTPTAAPTAAPTTRDASLQDLDQDTIFKIRSARTGKDVFLLNRASTVHMRTRASGGGSGGGFSFRNPPHFMPLVGERMGLWTNGVPTNPIESASPHDAENEMEAHITHLVEHESTPPFVSKLLIQRLVTSNPSPRYVKAVATAFATGSYMGKRYSGQVQV
jgi:cullin-associated NEDD8-dissociated protein 1